MRIILAHWEGAGAGGVLLRPRVLVGRWRAHACPDTLQITSGATTSGATEGGRGMTTTRGEIEIEIEIATEGATTTAATTSGVTSAAGVTAPTTGGTATGGATMSGTAGGGETTTRGAMAVVSVRCQATRRAVATRAARRERCCCTQVAEGAVQPPLSHQHGTTGAWSSEFWPILSVSTTTQTYCIPRAHRSSTGYW